MAAAILNDPRFKLARSLVTGGSSDKNSKEGGPSDAINIFAALLEECRSINETSLSSALCQFEYGNSIFRAVVRRKSDVSSSANNGKGNGIVDTNDNDKKPAAKKDNGQREVMAAAALKRSAVDGDESTTSSPNKRAKMDTSDTSSSSLDRKVASSTDVASSNIAAAKSTEKTDINEEDIQLALDMMQEAWSILLIHTTTVTDDSVKSDETNSSKQQQQEQEQWVLEQIPRVIRCIGDVYFFQEHYALATDSYIRARQYREENWDKLKQSTSSGDDGAMLTLQHLQCQRYLVEAYALVAEALLACPSGEDVVCYHSGEDEDDIKDESKSTAEAKKKQGGTVLCKGKDRMDFAQSHYESAREGLEEILVRYGKIAASSNIDVGNEKEDVGYLVMTVVDVGQTIQGQN